MERQFTLYRCNAKAYKSPGRAMAAGRKMFGNKMWLRAAEMGDGKYALDTKEGYYKQ